MHAGPIDGRFRGIGDRGLPATGACLLVWGLLFALLPVGPAWGADPLIEAIPPDRRGGKAYRLVYTVAVDADTYWRFKTDFDNDLLVRNKYIHSHRLVSAQSSRVISENVYSYDPAHVFRWQTTVDAAARRLDFQLLNAEACDQRFHFGFITVEAAPSGTRVTQTAYFDFWGVGLWYHYPWAGGMQAFLRYNVQWEQQLTALLNQRYADPPAAQ